MGKSTYTMGRGLSKRECVYDGGKGVKFLPFLVRLYL